ncbi:hypothetical protein BDN72DRAFT_747189, partial [Pluteus cervinus]
FGEVQYFFQHRNPGVVHTLAMLSIYTPRDSILWQESQGTLHACRYTGATNLRVVPAQEIKSVVGMPPLP